MNTNPSPKDRSAQAPRRTRHRMLLCAAATATVLVGAGGLTLAASGIANAAVDQTSSQYAEIGPLGYTGDQASQVTAVYTIQNVAEPGTEMLEDNGNNMNAGGTVDVWSQVQQGNYQDPMGTGPYGPITQANYLWEYVPDDPSAGGSIVDGPGELINRQSGLCLDVANNNTGDGAAIDQWGCNGGSNQQWTALDLNGHFMLQPMLDYATGFLGVGNGSTCVTSGDGDSVYVRTTGTAKNPCDEWTIQQASYDFATYAMQGVPNSNLPSESDNRTYQCVQGDHVRLASASEAALTWFDFYDLSTGTTATVNDTWPTPAPTFLPADTIQYGTNAGGLSVLAGDTGTGQVMLYCDPSTTTP